MAFQQPTRQLPQRPARPDPAGGEPILAPQSALTPNESQTWVLFTPGTDAGTTPSYLSSVQDDQITPGRSRISDLGSLDTAARSAGSLQALEEGVAEEDAELDSLDSHLPEFRIAQGPYNQPEVPHATPVLPGHDGLGSFRFEARGIGAEAQERLYAFERFNPNRLSHRTESFDVAQLELEGEEELERNSRIEAWRLEQSRLLLEDIRKETMKRQQSGASLRKLQKEVSESEVADEEAADINLSGTDWHDQDAPAPSDPGAGLWSRLARKVISELMGIDDKLLAILFGEALPEDGVLPPMAQASATDASSPALAHRQSESSHDSTWQLRMLERIARELGLLVHQMSSHPGAFSTYTRVQQMPLPYAGLPVIPETPADASEGTDRVDDSVPFMPQFKPTVSQRADVLGGRPSEPAAPPTSDAKPSEAAHVFTQQEWEQDLDIRLVFRYLRSRFTSSRPSSPPFSPGTSHLATSSTQDLAAKAARVRQHHPLVSHTHTHGYHRARPVERRTWKATVPSSPVAIRHPPGSCASQSTRRSARRSSISSKPSSRHYWDIGGSIGTGSVITSTGPMGSWGEV